MKPVIKAVFAVACISAIGLGGLAASARSQSLLTAKPDKQQIAEASDGDGETQDDAQSRAASAQPVIRTAPAQVADTKDQADTESAESPGGDGDGETNDDG